jgi:hypothetical protein
MARLTLYTQLEGVSTVQSHQLETGGMTTPEVIELGRELAKALSVGYAKNPEANIFESHYDIDSPSEWYEFAPMVGKSYVRVTGAFHLNEHFDEDYESGILWRVFPSSMSDEHIRSNWIGSWEGEYCQHSYDCCANWYRSKASIERVGRRALVKQSIYRNI